MLDIDELVPWTSTGKALIQTQLKLSSPELLGDKKYKVYILTTSNGSVEPITISLFPELPEPTPAPTKIPADIEEQMKLQVQKAIEEAEQRKQQRESEQKELEKLQEEESKKLEIISENTKQEMPDDNPNNTEQQIKEKPEYTPEPTDNTRIAEEKRCGAGTVIVDGICKVEQKPVQEEKGFFDWLMSLFRMAI